MCLFFGILGILGIIDDVLVDLGDLWVLADLFLNTIGYLWILDGSCLLFNRTTTPYGLWEKPWKNPWYFVAKLQRTSREKVV